MDILVTGARGLIGSALCSRLVAKGHRLICQSRSAHENSPGVTWIRHDLAADSPANLARLPTVDVVYHLAAQTSTYAAQQDPVRDLLANVLGFLNLLQAMRAQRSPPFVVLTGTATQIGLSDRLPLHEGLPDRPITFYDISKLTAEAYLKQYVREGWLTGCCLRLANVFGRHQPGQQLDRGIIDKIFSRALAGQEILIYGDGDYVRDYVFIDDVVSALELAPEHRDRTNGRAFYIGTGIATTLKDAFLKVGALAARISGKQAEFRYVEPPGGLSDIEFRNAVIDNSAFREATGWSPKYDFQSGLEAAYQSFLGGAPPPDSDADG